MTNFINNSIIIIGESMFKIKHTKEEILDIINHNKFLSRFIVFLIGIFGVSLNYNLFFVPNKLVVGGISGLS